MAWTFINREPELSFLNSEFNEERSSLVVIYGRRRVGKTTLIKKFIEDKKSLYFIATEESERENKKNLQYIVSDHTGNTLLKKDIVLEWEEILLIIKNHEPDSKKIVVIDEFQYLGKNNKSFPSVFQKIWDTHFKDSNIMFILCGSLVSMMIDQTLSYSSPLYGRRTGQLRMNPISFEHYHSFFKKSDSLNLIEYYSVTGGAPKYIELFKPSGNIFEDIKNNILSKQSFLYDEPVFLLEKEVGETGTYFSIIKSIAAGNRKLGRIAADLGIAQSGITKYLKTLIDLDLVKREVPITEKNPEKSKKGLYFIKDNFINFWFKFVWFYRQYLEIDNIEPVMKRIREHFRDNHVSFVYEDICRDKLMKMSSENEIDIQILKCGRWWDKNTEIDIIGVSEGNSELIFGECKYTEKKSNVEVYLKLKEKSEKVISDSGCKKSYILFSKSGFTKSLKLVAEETDNLYLKIL